jgi:hypothetical protein
MRLCCGRPVEELVAQRAVAREIDRRPCHRQRTIHQRLVRLGLDAMRSDTAAMSGGSASAAPADL